MKPREKTPRDLERGGQTNVDEMDKARLLLGVVLVVSIFTFMLAVKGGNLSWKDNGLNVGWVPKVRKSWNAGKVEWTKHIPWQGDFWGGHDTKVKTSKGMFKVHGFMVAAEEANVVYEERPYSNYLCVETFRKTKNCYRVLEG